MKVAGHQQAHLGVPLDDRPEAVRVQQPGVVHEPQPGLKGWEVGEHEGGPVRVCGKHVIQPAFAYRVETAVVAAGNRVVQAHEADGVVFDHIAAVVVGEVAREDIGEGPSEQGTLVMVTRDGEQPVGNGGQHVEEGGVLRCGAVIGQVAGGEDHIRGRIQAHQVVNDPPEGLGGVDQPGEPSTLVADVAVGDLRDQHTRTLCDRRQRWIRNRSG